MNMEGFFLGDSVIHRLDPRGRIIVCFIMVLLLAVSTSPYALAAGGVIALIYAVFAKLGIRKLLIRLAVVNLFVLFLWLFLPFTTPGNAIWSYSNFTVTREGVNLCAAITARSNIIIVLFISLISTIPAVNIGFALQQMYFPEKLFQIFFFAVRYLQVIDSERERLFNAAQVRGFVPKMNLHTYRTISYFIGMLFVKSIDRAERVYEAMLCRGFNGRFYVLEHFSFRKNDFIFLIFGISGIAGIALFEFYLF